MSKIYLIAIDPEEFLQYETTEKRRTSLRLSRASARTYHKLAVINASVTKGSWLSPFNRYTRLKAGPNTNKILTWNIKTVMYAHGTADSTE